MSSPLLRSRIGPSGVNAAAVKARSSSSSSGAAQASRNFRSSAAAAASTSSESQQHPSPPPQKRKRSLVARLGQSFNPSGIALFGKILLVSEGAFSASNRQRNSKLKLKENKISTSPSTSTYTQKKKTSSSAPLLLPHLTVSDVSRLDWRALAAAGFRAAVFDKDNTLTAPYSLELTAEATRALADAAEAFGREGSGGESDRSSLALLSNSAGLKQYDPEGHEAEALEAALGVAVIRHSSKKPAGDAAAIVRHFSIGDGTSGALTSNLSSSSSISPSEIVMVGDRYLTDVAFGNRLGMLTVRVDPIEKSGKGEPRAVAVSRRVEEALVRRRERKGMRAPEQVLVERERRQRGASCSREEVLEGFVRM